VGEEPPISGTRGSGAFFFSHCPLFCVYCQNFPISQLGHGRDVSIEEMARRMRILEKRGAHNINIVTGTPFAPHIVEAVALARQAGLALPIVWNTSGFESGETIDLLNGTVDIYLTDIKYADDETAKALSDAPDYFAVATGAARRMLDQVGPLQTDDEGIGKRGVIIRHLVLPSNLSQTEQVMATIADRFGDQVHVSLMGQYFPAHRAHSVADVDRPLADAEYARARQAARDAKITKGWFQEMDDPFLKRGA
jgi:putative pyruvate formate lyase activating enzyme